MHSGVKAQRENTAVVKDKVHHKSDNYANTIKLVCVRSLSLAAVLQR